jgi:hypothetical protein
MEERTPFREAMNAAIAVNVGRYLVRLYPDCIALRGQNACRWVEYRQRLKAVSLREAGYIETFRQGDLRRRWLGRGRLI